MSNPFVQAQQEGLCLRFPEQLGPRPQLTYHDAFSLLFQGAQRAQAVPFSWMYIDKPVGLYRQLPIRCQVLNLIYRCNRWLLVSALPPAKRPFS